MQRIEVELAVGIGAVLTSIVALGWWARRQHQRTHEGLERAHDRIGQLGDLLEEDQKGERRGLRELRLVVHKHVREGLEFLRGLVHW